MGRIALQAGDPCGRQADAHGEVREAIGADVIAALAEMTRD